MKTAIKVAAASFALGVAFASCPHQEIAVEETVDSRTPDEIYVEEFDKCWKDRVTCLQTASDDVCWPPHEACVIKAYRKLKEARGY
jgi:hypothetical protein